MQCSILRLNSYAVINQKSPNCLSPTRHRWFEQLTQASLEAFTQNPPVPCEPVNARIITLRFIFTR